MVYSGPQHYPPASTAYWYQDNYPGDRMESNVGEVHTTEGTSLPSYGGGASAPNFTAKPDFANKRLVWYQHFDFDCSSRASVNLPGGVQTNTLNVVQIELVGTCDPTTHKNWNDKGIQHMYWPAAPDWALLEFAKFVRWASDNHGLKMVSTVTWKAYPGSYGASNGVRLSGSAWSSYYGWLGHQHVPENLHGDPGAFPMGKVLAFAKDKTWEKEAVMAITDADADKIATAVLKKDGIIKVSGASADNPTWATHSVLAEALKRVDAVAAQARVNGEALTKIQAVLDAIDPDALAAQLAETVQGLRFRLDDPAA